jgi:chromosome segregation ATPase
MAQLRDDLRAAQLQGRRMEEILRKFSGGEEDPASLAARLQELEAANRDLLERLSKGRAGVERLLARIRFLEEQG